MKKPLQRLFLSSMALICASACGNAQQQSNNMPPRVNAPDFAKNVAWLNTDKPLSLTSDLKGKIVLLDFWTYGCINCQHIIPDLKRLEKEYSKELVVIGVHSAKFDMEKNTANIRKAALKYGIEHPIINDAEFSIWNSYAVSSWPTVTLITPDGKVALQESGEGVYNTFKPAIESLLKEYEGKINETSLKFKQEVMTSDVLRFPAHLCKDNKNNIYVTDAGHNRIVKINEQGKILATIGNGKQELQDGNYSSASFNDPQGLVAAGKYVYVADTRNHSIRRIDTETEMVETLWGNGQQQKNYLKSEARQGEPLNSPWDLAIDGNTMYISMAGNHQIWKANFESGVAEAFAGNGREALVDGALNDCSFSQPSGICLYGNKLFIADPEASAVRELDLKTKQVKTLVGHGLFDFGDVDGLVEKALIQHNSSVAANGNLVYIVDTYNGKIKTYNKQTNAVTTIISGLEEPNHVLIDGNSLWITNTNNNQLLKVDLKTFEKQMINIVK